MILIVHIYRPMEDNREYVDAGQRLVQRQFYFCRLQNSRRPTAAGRIARNFYTNARRPLAAGYF